jgi:hypothetical protein
MVRRAAAGVALAAVVLASAGLIWAGASTPAGAADEGLLQTTPEGFSDAEFVIRVNEDGSARWTIRASRPLENQSEIDQFRAFAEEFETTETTAFRDFRARARRLTAFGSNATGREMNATDFRREARVVELGQTRGVVELSFRWTNFARTDGRRVDVDDVFEGGMFVDSGPSRVGRPAAGLPVRRGEPRGQRDGHLVRRAGLRRPAATRRPRPAGGCRGPHGYRLAAGHPNGGGGADFHADTGRRTQHRRHRAAHAGRPRDRPAGPGWRVRGLRH